MIIIARKGTDLKLHRNGTIFEVMFLDEELGWFPKEELGDAIIAIIEKGFYGGRNYDERIDIVKRFGNLKSWYYDSNKFNIVETA